MKNVKSMILTMVCAAAILAVGYGGLLFSGEQVLKSSSEPEPVTMEGNISNLFYSRIDDDIQLYPWNYYPTEENPGTTGGVVESYVWLTDLPYLENEVFYTLIARAANKDHEEVARWYEEQNKSIWDSMKQGVWDNQPVDIFFYDEVIRLGDGEYEVKIACDPVSIISFSCIPVREAGVKDTEEWEENREEFLKRMEKYYDSAMIIFEAMYSAYWNNIYAEDWWYYVELFGFCQEISYGLPMKSSGETSWEALQNYSELADAYGVDIVEEDMSIQMIELSDCLLLMMEQDITVGLYYDVIEQRVTGFHYFFQ